MTSMEEATERLAERPLDVWEFDRVRWKRILEENGFRATYIDTLSSGGTLTMSLSNPAGSGVTALVAALKVGSLGAASVRVYDSFSSDPTGGDTVQVENLLMGSDNGSPDSGEVTASSGVSFTGTGTHSAAVVGGGVGVNAAGGEGAVFSFALEPDRQVVVEMSDEADAADVSYISADFVEVDGTFSS